MIFPKALLKCCFLCFVLGVTEAQDDRPFPGLGSYTSHLGTKAFPYTMKRGVPHIFLGRGSQNPERMRDSTSLGGQAFPTPGCRAPGSAS